MMKVSEAITKMISISEGNQHDICHFMKVWGFARTIGEAEGLDERTLMTLELAAVVHDIACPILRKEIGRAPGGEQEKAGPPLVREFYKDSGLDYQILLEADFLVNAGEQENDRKAVSRFQEKVFKTRTGLKLFDDIYHEAKT